jgi:hypothetical protein
MLYKNKNIIHKTYFSIYILLLKLFSVLNIFNLEITLLLYVKHARKKNSIEFQ